MLIVGDLHSDIPARYNYSGGNYILDGWVKTLNFIVKLAKKEKVKSIIFLGDIFSEKDRIPNRIKNILIKVFEKLAKKYDVYVLEGNHDNKGEDSSLLFLSPYATIINELRDIRIGKKKVLCVPYDADIQYLEESLNKKNPKNFDLVIGHFGISGAGVGKIKRFNAGVNLKLVKRFKMVMCGHYHRFQKLAKNIYHLGSVYQEDWGEADETKKVAIFKKGKMSFKTIPRYVNRMEIDLDDSNYLPELELGKGHNFLSIKVLNSIDAIAQSHIRKHYEKKGFVEVTFDVVSEAFEQEIKVDGKKKLNKMFKKFIKKAIKNVKESKRGFYQEVLWETLEM